MKKRLWFLFPFAALTVACFFLRRMTLANGFDAQGLPIADLSWTLLILCCTAACALAAAVSFSLSPRASFTESFRFSPILMLAGIAAAMLFAAGNLFTFRQAQNTAEKLGAVLGIVGALGWVGVLAALKKSSRPSPWLQMPAILGCIPLFILRFRSWGLDPILGDYCFLLLACAAQLLSLFYLAGFAFDCGKRRMTFFFSAAALLFTAAALPDADLPVRLCLIGSALYCGSFSVQLLRD